MIRKIHGKILSQYFKKCFIKVPRILDPWLSSSSRSDKARIAISTTEKCFSGQLWFLEESMHTRSVNQGSMLSLASRSISGPSSPIWSNASRFLLFSRLSQSVFASAIRENILSSLAFEEWTLLYSYIRFNISRYDKFGLFWKRGIMHPLKISHSCRSLPIWHSSVTN